jgi:tetratricopeptide (TPR) repeat protein
MRAARRGDFPAAVSLLTRAAALLPDAHEDRREILPVLGTALMRTGDFAHAGSVLDDALAAARSAGDRRLELRALIEREFLWTFTKPGESLEAVVAVADEAIPVLEELGDDAGLAKAWVLRSIVHLHACRWGERAEHLERALDHARRAGDAAEQSTIAGHITLAVYYGPTPVADAIHRCEALLDEQPADKSLEAAITSALAGLTAMRGDFDEGRRLQQKGRHLYEELGMRFRIGVRSLIAADIELLAGQPDEAVAILRWAMDSLREMGVTSVGATVAAFLADALASAGSNEAARRHAALAEETSDKTDIVNQVMWRVALARATGDRRPAREAVALAEATDSPDLKARAYAAAGDLDRARAAYEAKGNVAAVRQLLAYYATSP